MRLLISAGEASGESYGALLIAALKQREPSLDCFGVGGERMRGAGCRLVVDAKDIAVVGLAEVISEPAENPRRIPQTAARRGCRQTQRRRAH